MLSEMIMLEQQSSAMVATGAGRVVF